MCASSSLEELGQSAGQHSLFYKLQKLPIIVEDKLLEMIGEFTYSSCYYPIDAGDFFKDFFCLLLVMVVTRRFSL